MLSSDEESLKIKKKVKDNLLSDSEKEENYLKIKNYSQKRNLKIYVKSYIY
jgi:hypothetical protein